MAIYFEYDDSFNDDPRDDYFQNYKSQEEQDEEDDYINSRGGIDKCMNCGKYMYNDSLTYPGQVCIKGCVNPNEY